MEVVNGETGDGPEELRLELGDDVLQGVLAKVSEVHERRDSGSELDQLLLNLLALALVLLLLVREFRLLLGGDVVALLLLSGFDLLALVDDGLEDVGTKRTKALDLHDRF